MERKIGEIFEYNGEWYQCIIGHCNQCCFDEAGTCKFIGDPYCAYRNDKKLVCFKKLEKVGEPYSCNYYGDNRLIMMQEYNLYNLDDVTNEDKIPMYITDYKHKRIAIEIKVNKEDMKEKDIKPYDKNFSEGTVSNTENLVTSSFKPFDLEAAKAGKPVCTRDGRKARIICFDAKDTQPIIGLYEKNIDGIVREYLCSYHTDGRMYDDQDTGYDLMMLPEKKEGWINVYNSLGVITFSHNPFDSKEEALAAEVESPNKYYVDTIKISWEE